MCNKIIYNCAVYSVISANHIFEYICNNSFHYLCVYACVCVLYISVCTHTCPHSYLISVSGV